MTEVETRTSQLQDTVDGTAPGKAWHAPVLRSFDPRLAANTSTGITDGNTSGS